MAKSKPEAAVYTIKEIAAKLHISYNTALRMVESGKLKAFDISSTGGNKLWRVPKEALDELMNAA